MKQHKDLFSIDRMSKVLVVSRAGFYRYLNRPKSMRAQEDARLAFILKKIHKENRGVYGFRRLMDALRGCQKLAFF
jgi:putative transposase